MDTSPRQAGRGNADPIPLGVRHPRWSHAHVDGLQSVAGRKLGGRADRTREYAPFKVAQRNAALLMLGGADCCGQAHMQGMQRDSVCPRDESTDAQKNDDDATRDARVCGQRADSRLAPPWRNPLGRVAMTWAISRNFKLGTDTLELRDEDNDLIALLRGMVYRRQGPMPAYPRERSVSRTKGEDG